LIFVSWAFGFVLVLFSLLREYVQLFRREQEKASQLQERQQDLAASEAKFRAVFERAAVGMGRVRFDDARWMDVNAAFCRMLGRGKEEVLATPWPEITHREDVHLDLEQFKRMAAGELDSYTVEKRFLRQHGRPVWARLTLSLVRKPGGDPDYEIAVIEDITEQINAREALRSSEHRFRSVMENMSEGLMLFDSERNLTYQNPASLRIHGFDPQHDGRLRNTDLPVTWEAWDESGRKISFEEWPVSRVFRHERFQNQVLHVRRVETGQEFYGSYNGCPVYDAEGKLAFGFITIRDITVERMARLRADHLQSLTAAFSQAIRPADVIEAAVTLGGAALGATGGAVALLTEDESAFELVAGPGIDQHLASPWRQYSREPHLPAGRATETRRPCYSRTRAEYVAHDPRLEAVAKASNIEAEATLPLVVGERVLGVLSFIFPTPRAFEPADDAYLRAVAEQCAQALERTRLFEAEHEAREALARAHTEVQAAAERVQLALAAGAIVGTWDWDLRTDRFTVDESFAENFGIDPALGRSGLSLDQVSATVHPDDLPGLRAAISEVISRGGAYSHEYRVRGRDGVYRWLQANGRVDHAPDGTPTRFPGVLLDVEGRRALEAERDRAAQLLRAFIDAVPGVVYAKDRGGRMLVANRGVSELVGKSPEEYLGKTDLELLDRKDEAEAVMATDRRIMETGQAETLEEELSYPEGRRAVWLSTKAPFRDAKGSVIGLIGSSIDITARKAVEAALRLRTEQLTEVQKHLEKALKTRDEFLSIASHELKTPLTSIRLQTQSIRRAIVKGKVEVYNPERVNRLVEQTDKQTLRLTRLVDDMLDISRVRSGRLKIEAEPFDFCEMVREVVERMKPQLVEAHGSATLVSTCGCVSGSWDRTRLEQVLTNLLTNAMRYGSGKPVEIRVARPDADHVRLSVTDRGIGVAKEDHERIFNRFERAVDANEVSGLGLGLSISRELVHAHNGRIWVESELGQGATFHVELPVTAGSQGAGYHAH
jgi:PAS domain S-box-containing protein